MKYWLAGVLALGLVHGLAASTGAEGKQIRQILIDESIAAYSANCPCRSVRRAMGRSWAAECVRREGGAAPLCYAKDVTNEW